MNVPSDEACVTRYKKSDTCAVLIESVCSRAVVAIGYLCKIPILPPGNSNASPHGIALKRDICQRCLSKNLLNFICELST